MWLGLSELAGRVNACELCKHSSESDFSRGGSQSSDGQEGPFVDFSTSLARSLSLLSGLLNKMATVERMEVLRAFSKSDFRSLRLIWLQSQLSAQVPTAEPNSEPPIWRHDLLSFTRPDPYLPWAWLCLPSPRCSCQSHHLRTYRCLLRHHSSPRSFAPDHVHSVQPGKGGHGPVFS